MPPDYTSPLPDVYTTSIDVRIPRRDPVFSVPVTVDFRGQRYRIGEGDWQELRRARPRPIASIDILADDGEE